MSDSESASRSDPALGAVSSETERSIDIDALLTVLAEEYTTEILAAVGTGSVPAREIADETGASRPTVYRRLNRLEAIGVLETTMVPSPGGQRRQAFELVLEEVEVPLVADVDAVADGS
ncbi:transcriptional regulator [Natrinema pellirubrum DSM 15624]|uniref:Transcriptional regulator n=1 Tax=Natrinema pellirubrum (strain DSM 15624 / CIP 106293 / JCM 10476 / NCIMB 786 / 157) TaxID=797303 RepID=L0JK60_NATP1|nr:winged helix-turn-helix domain-containing protein [Natrinema pellirubrum]AGB31659.1 putative transcriptional regulator [Natrinema pellirubrum DSM 15624]ELY73028.1 transcriptional regulator [Natrinema pellirubrum DSM 15624]